MKISVPFSKIMKENAFSSPPSPRNFFRPFPTLQAGGQKKKKQFNETNILKIYLYMHQIFDG